MLIKVKTATLQEMMVKAIRGSSNNKMIPITSLMAISLLKGDLMLTTTDASNTLQIIEHGAGEGAFYAVVQADLFSKLVAKTSTEFITLTLSENSLQVKGNGKYDIELPLDDEGQPIHFPIYKFDHKAPPVVINLSVIKSILLSNKAALAQTMEQPCLTGYYFGENVITTDTLKVCSNAVKVFEDSALIPMELLELVSLMDEDKITVQRTKGKLLFTTSKVTIYGSELLDIEDYPVEAIQGFLQTEFKYKCKVAKAAMLSVLDRLSLFVATYDNNGINLTWSATGLTINSRRSNGIEEIPYAEAGEVLPFTCCIDIELFKSQIAAQEAEILELWYGHDKAIKMVAGKITQIVALLEDDSTASIGEQFVESEL